ncbi:MAG: OmpA family protein [Saprospiraceae bacterium]|nr:OmpA family protein [Saprospiraceae bacterium]
MNLIEMLQNTVGETLVNKASSMLGENQSNTKSALGAALPALLGSVISKGSSNSGAQGIMDLISKVAGSNLDISSLNSNEGVEKVSNLGGGLLSSILGPKAGAVADFIGNFSGIKSSSATSLLSMAAPFLLGSLGKANGSNGISGLMSLLSSQSGIVSSLLPSGLSSVLGLGDITAKASSRVSDSYQPNTYINEEKKSGGMGWWPWLLAALAIAGLLYALRGCNKSETMDAVKDTATEATSSISEAANDAKDAASAALDTVANKAGDAVDAAKNAIAGSLSKTGEWVYDLGALIKAKLPNGIELSIPERGVENKLIGFIADPSKAVSKDVWFTMDRLLFETGKSTLVPSSQEQLKNIAAILKAFPNVNIKLGGYTDNVGKPEANVALSQSRAENVKGQLVKMGIAASRLAAEGYGEQHPVADNTTAEGRAQNRRIDIRVTKK